MKRDWARMTPESVWEELYSASCLVLAYLNDPEALALRREQWRDELRAAIHAIAAPGTVGPHPSFDHGGTARHHHDSETGDPVWWLESEQFGGESRDHLHGPTGAEYDRPVSR